MLKDVINAIVRTLREANEKADESWQVVTRQRRKAYNKAGCTNSDSVGSLNQSSHDGD